VVLLAGAMVAVFFISRFFLVALLLAAVSAGIFRPIRLWLQRRLSRAPRLTTLVSMIVFCLIILIPVGALAYFTVNNLIDIAQKALGRNQTILSQLRDFEASLRRLPLFQGALGNLLSSDRLSQLLQQAASGLLKRLTGLVENLVRFFLMLFVYLYSLYFFIRDGGEILRGIGEAIPLPQEDTLEVGQKFLSVARAILKTALLIGGMQGLIGGILYWAVGIEAPVLWGILMMIFGSIPGIGSVIVWLPTAVVLAVLGQYVRAAVVIGVGIAMIPLVELLRPYLIGTDTRIHPVLVLVGVLGGIWVFGISGLLLGPLIMGVAVTLWDIFKRLFSRELRSI
jgi:predicted PurR-regulated permease PerM